MRTAEEIIDFAQAIAEKFPVKKIILFGSYAYGNPTDDSDVDLLVVKRYRGDSAKASTRLWASARVYFPLDLLVRSPVEIRKRVGMNDWFIRDIIEKGLVLYDAIDAGVGKKSRSRLRHRINAASLAKAHAV